jgi:hypothetical protein
MVIDFTVQTAPLLWAILAVLLLLALVIFASIDPDLAEVLLGDTQILLATVALAAFAIFMVSGGADWSRHLGLLAPGR